MRQTAQPRHDDDNLNSVSNAGIGQSGCHINNTGNLNNQVAGMHQDVSALQVSYIALLLQRSSKFSDQEEHCVWWP